MRTTISEEVKKSFLESADLWSKTSEGMRRENQTMHNIVLREKFRMTATAYRKLGGSWDIEEAVTWLKEEWGEYAFDNPDIRGEDIESSIKQMRVIYKTVVG